MKDNGAMILKDIIKLTRSSEEKFKRGNFKGALEDKMKANAMLKSKSCNEKIIEKYRKELSSLYSSQFDLIFDHKRKINQIKINEIVKILERKSTDSNFSFKQTGYVNSFLFFLNIYHIPSSFYHHQFLETYIYIYKHTHTHIILTKQ